MDTEQVNTINKKIFQLDVSEHRSKPDHNHIEPKTTVYTPKERDVNKLYILYKLYVYMYKTEKSTWWNLCVISLKPSVQNWVIIVN